MARNFNHKSDQPNLKWMHHCPGMGYLFKLHKNLADRMIWPYSIELDSLFRWRAYILSAILLAGLVFGSFAFAAAGLLIIKKNVWGLAAVDLLGLILCLLFLFKHQIRFEIRALLTILTFYIIGMAVIISVGPLSGGAAWLFAFAVLAGVLLGSRAAIIAILMNFISLSLVGILISKGIFGSEFPFFTTRQAMIAAGVNFIVLNAITAVSVSALLNLLHASEKRYRLIAKNVADVIWTMDMDLNFTYVSPSIRHMLGYSENETLKKSMAEILAPHSLENILRLYDKKMKQLAENDEKAWKSVIFEAEHYRKDGSTVLVNIHARLIRGPGSQALGILGITRDITERKKIESEKIKAQIMAQESRKLALIGQIAGKMAHDFNNVLGIIMGHSELALMTCHDEELKSTFKLIFQQTIRGKNLTKNLIAFAQHQEPEQEFFIFNEKIEFVLDLLKNDLSGIQVNKDLRCNMEILADPGMIEHAFVNLIQNSIHALSLSKNPQISLKTDCSDQFIIFEIADNGCGIPEDQIRHIFEPAFTLKGSKDILSVYKEGIKGTGYGLANVKKYIDLHKGTIDLSSTPGKGSRFRVSLPVIKRDLTRDEKEAIDRAKPISGKKILLVEDETAILDVQQNVLSQAPCSHIVSTATNGEDAVALFDQGTYDLISLDYILPGKLNGMDVYRHIRKKNKSVPILFVSGNIDFIESILTLKQDDPNIDHLSKPCLNVEYVNRINSLFSRNA